MKIQKDFFEHYNKNKELKEGIIYDKYKHTYIFNFNEDNPNDAIYLSDADLKVIEYMNKTYIYGYTLRKEGIESSKFVSWLKDQLNEGNDTEEINKFIYDAIYWLQRDFNLNTFKCIIYPDTKENKLVTKIIRYIKDSLYEYNAPTAYYSVIKNLPSKIEFDWELFKENNKDLYTKKENVAEEKERLKNLTQTENRINSLLDIIHKKDYFKLHECGFKVNERQYLKNFLRVDNATDYSTLEKLINTDRVLLVDDTITSGTTINEMIRAISIINPNCEILIFTLIKGKDGKF